MKRVLLTDAAVKCPRQAEACATGIGRLAWVVLLAALAMPAQVVPEVRAALAAQDFAGAEKVAEEFKKQQGVNGEYLEAHSWLGRGALAAKKYDQALRYAAQTRQLSLDLLKTRKLDAEPRLPIGFGASIEVNGQALAALGQRTEAVSFLQTELKSWRETSIRTRIQKNLHLLSLEGKPAPALELSEWVGSAQPAALKGKPQVLFFWAHWCADCKQQGPVLARLAKEFGKQGLTVVLPTQRYGYAAGGEDTTPAAEAAYIATVRKDFYGVLKGATPLSQENFRNYGCSTSPTLVLVDRAGIVRLYHPGKMTYEELLPKIRAIVGAS